MRKITSLLLFLLCTNVVFGQFGGENIISSDGRYPKSISSPDIDGDGNLDILLSEGIGPSEITWYKNLGNNRFSLKKIVDVHYGGTAGYIDIIPTDIDNDGDIDIVAYLSSDTIVWYQNNGSGIFGSKKIITINANMLIDGHVVDIDNDGDVDIISASTIGVNKIVWYENLGGGVIDSSQNIISINSNSANHFSSINSGDFDNDGNIDIISTTTGIGKVAWYKNLGGGVIDTTQNIVSILSASFANKYALPCDMDNDGNLDVLTNGGNDLFWLKNLGGGVFDTIQYIVELTAGPKSIYLVDLDNDGDIDVLKGTGPSNSKLSWHENLGSGVFGAGQTISTTEEPSSIYAADIDNDGDIDIFSTSTNHKISIYENNGNNIFNNFKNLSLSNFSIDKNGIADMDLDNDIDIIARYFKYSFNPSLPLESGLLLLKNSGSGEFIEHDTITTYLPPSSSSQGFTSFTLSDIDNDGLLDVIASNNGDSTLFWIKNLGAGNFGAKTTILTNVHFVTDIIPKDMDGDLDIDLIISMQNSNLILWIENNGGTFTTQHIIDNNMNAKVLSEDIDNDGDNDIVILSNFFDRLSWYENLGGGNFGSEQVISSNAFSTGKIELADINNDGNIDIVASFAFQSPTNYKILWYENLGGGTFNIIANLVSNNVHYNNITSGDLDGDGNVDIVSCSSNGDKISWYRNLGGGIFSTEQLINTNLNQASSVYTADLDGDGDLDVLARSTLAIYQDGKIVWHENYFNSPYQLKGNVFYDQNQNKLLDSNELGFSYIQTQIQPSNQISYTTNIGQYFFAVDTGAYTVSYTPSPFWGLTTDSISFTKSLTSFNPSYDSLDFGFYPDTIFTSVQSDLTGGFPRCNDTINYWISVQNQGTTISSGIIHLQLDDSITYLSANIPPDSIIGQNIYWSYNNLFFYSHNNINLNVIMPPFTSMGDTLSSYLTTNATDSLGNTIYTSIDTLNQVSVCAYDPNDKTVLPKGIGIEGFISHKEPYLEYLIRFQNTGNDTAINVKIVDQLDMNIEWSSLQLISSSYPVQININSNGKAIFNFNNIMLPDSNVDFLGSQGYVKFRVNLKTGLISGTEIYNTGHIYFDNNPAVITNTVVNTIYDCDNINLSGLNTSLCFGDSLSVSTLEGDVFNYFWEIGTFYADSSVSVLNWLADTSGTFDFKLTTRSMFCVKDTITSITIHPEIPVINYTLFICQGDSILINGNYENSSGIFIDSLQTINGCDSVLSTTLTVNSLPNVTLTNFNPDTICSNGSAVALPNGSPSGGVYSGTGVNGGTFDPSIAGIGTHSVIYTYTDINSCINSDSTFITVEQCVGIDGLENDLGILIYPNPNTGLFTIEKPTELDKEVNISLLDASSRVIIDKIIPKGQQKIEMDITSYSKGVYYLQLTIGDKVYVKQILKN